MELFIPARIQKDSVFGKGFGKTEMRRTVIGTLSGLGLGLGLGLAFYNQSYQTVLIAMVITGVIFACCSYFICLKNSINLSPFDYLGLVKRFWRTQRFYKYRKLKEWAA